MGGRYHDRFFDEKSSQSRTKLRIYETYLKPWSAKLGSRGGTIWVVDGYAGRGRYRNGEPGSPEIAMRLAKEVANKYPHFRLKCLFADKRSSNTEMLYQLSGEYREAGAQIIEGDFWRRTDDVLKLVGPDPALLFVDPFGLKGLEFPALARLVSSLRRVDIIINFRSPAAARLETQYREAVSLAVGSDDWDVANIGAVFRRNLKAAGGFLEPASLTVRHRFHGAVQSELILASRSPDAYKLWNDQVVIEAERLLAESDDKATIERDADIEEVRTRVERWAEGKKRWRRREIVDWHAVAYCGEVHTGTVKRAIDQLLASRWKRAGQAKKIDEDYLTWA